MKLHTNIIILSVLACFILNNLLFTYANEKHNRIVLVCESEKGECMLPQDLKDICCQMEDCCARSPVQSAHINFSVIIGLDKKQDPSIQTPELSNFNLYQIEHAAELCEGHLNSLIKPPAQA